MGTWRKRYDMRRLREKSLMMEERKAMMLKGRERNYDNGGGRDDVIRNT